MNEIKAHNTMSPEAQRIAIAEACGWLLDHINRSAMYYVPSSDCHVGDPLSDLNAMHEAVMSKMNTRELRNNYSDELCGVVACSTQMGNGTFWMENATAPQRCEAFLRTIGKWEGS